MLKLRPVVLVPGAADFAEGSCLIRQGGTHVLCTATVECRVPPFLRDKGQGWVTAEYAMLPRCSPSRIERDAVKGKVNARASEISRLVGRALRTAVDLKALGEHTITIDCDVLRADGGTRCASITGGMVALAGACAWLVRERKLSRNPLRRFVAAVSAGLVDGKPALDLCYAEDSRADADVNFVVAEDGRWIEVQGTAEGEPFSSAEFDRLRALAAAGVRRLVSLQKSATRRAGWLPGARR